MLSAALKQEPARDLATPMTIDPRGRHPVLAEGFCIAGRLRRSSSRSIPLGGARAGDLFVGPRSPRHPELRLEAETSASWPRMR